jgi:hypothetical protein
MSNPNNKPVLDLLNGHSGSGGFSINDSAFIGKLDPRLAHPVLVGFAHSMDLVFTIGGFVLVLAFAASWFLPEEKLRTISGLQARQDQDAKDAAATNGSDAVVGEGVSPAAGPVAAAAPPDSDSDADADADADSGAAPASTR